MRVTFSKLLAALKPKRRWFQYSLRTIFLLLTVSAVLLAWLRIRINRAEQQERAVKDVEKAHGLIRFDYELDKSGRERKSPQPPAPEWLRKAVGEEYFRRVVAVDFAVGAGLRSGKQISATDEDLRYLASLTDIKTLELGDNTDITDAGLVHLSGLRRLQTLYLYGTSISGAGLAHLTDLPQLESLHLGSTPLEDEGLKHIGKMWRLRWLVLEKTRITDDGLACLASLEDLRVLRLGNTDITDVGLRHLEGLTRLEQLSLNGTSISAAGAKQIREALPKCDVPVTYGLGQTPKNVPLWPEDRQPAREELLARLSELGIGVQTDNSRPGTPVVCFTLFDSTLSDQVVVGLLHHFPHLERINLRRALVGDRLLKAIKDRPQITYLSLESSRITDSGLEYLSSLSNLQELVLAETGITDAGLPYLRNLVSLRYLSLRGTRVTTKGCYQLQQTLPGCRIEY